MGYASAIFMQGGQGKPLRFKVTFEQEEVVSGRKSIPCRRNGKGKGPKVRALLNCSQSSKGPVWMQQYPQ